MAMIPRRPGALRKRVATYALGTDVVVSALVGLIIGATFGWILFIVGLAIIGFLYYQFTNVMRMRGIR